MVIRAAAYSPADNEYSGESIYSSAYFMYVQHPLTGVARTGYDETNGSNRLVWILRQNTLIKVTREKQSKMDHHALVEYDPAVTEYPINSYMLFTPPVTVKKLIRP